VASDHPPPSPRRSDACAASMSRRLASSVPRPAAGGAGDRAVPTAPRILVVMADQWPRATLRAALREVGYDAIGTRSLSGALVYPARVLGRGPVRAIVVDAGVVSTSTPDAADADALEPLLQRHGAVPLVLLGSAVHADPPGAWTRILRRPFSIQDVVAAVSEIVPLPPELRGPVDRR
jgi:hypothetical protein